jgi:hypothetical protein
MLTKRVTVYFLASVFSVATHVSSVASQPRDENCDRQETLSDPGNKCNDDDKYNGIDRTVTNSTTQGDDRSNANSAANTDSTDGSDHDNGHGNDPDHDDSSNPGQGGGNHGTGNNGNGNGPGK